MERIGESAPSYVYIYRTSDSRYEKKAKMSRQTSPIPSGQPARHSFWQRLHTTLIRWGILAPPGASEADLTEEERATRKRFFFEFRRQPHH